MRARLILLFVLALVIGAMAAPVGVAAARPTNLAVPVDVTGTIPGGGAFDGTFTLDRITSSPGTGLQAVGTLTGTLTDALGNVIGTVTDFPVVLPLTATGTCDVLHLTLGLLDLNLLGLMVHLDQVVLDVTAQSGPGNLVGNLVCAGPANARRGRTAHAPGTGPLDRGNHRPVEHPRRPCVPKTGTGSDLLPALPLGRSRRGSPSELTWVR